MEVADVYDRSTNELIAIKRGTNTSLASYSFEQSLLSIQVLSNKQEFSLKKRVKKFNKRPQYPEKIYPTLTEKMIKEILSCKNSTVLWLIDDEVKYIYKQVTNKTFKLQYFNSLLLKLKIVDWYLFVKDSGFNPKLYFAIDNPIDRKTIERNLVSVIKQISSLQ